MLPVPAEATSFVLVAISTAEAPVPPSSVCRTVWAGVSEAPVLLRVVLFAVATSTIQASAVTVTGVNVCVVVDPCVELKVVLASGACCFAPANASAPAAALAVATVDEKVATTSNGPVEAGMPELVI
jgi:hypothetical protein